MFFITFAALIAGTARGQSATTVAANMQAMQTMQATEALTPLDELWLDVRTARSVMAGRKAADGAASISHAAGDSRDRRDQAAAYRALVEDLVVAARGGTPVAGLAVRAQELQLTLTQRGRWLELYPAAPDAPAAGMLAVRVGALPVELVIQAPDPFSERHTGRIAAQLFASSSVRALYLDLDGAPQPQDGASAPAADDLQLVTAAMIDALQHPTVVQLHGYARGTSSAAAVVSMGATATSSAATGRWASVVRAALGGDVQTSLTQPQLAALRNEQGRLLRGHGQFVHIALGLSTRLSLRRDPEGCSALAMALVARALAIQAQPAVTT